jgi:hypothetical protein
MHEPSVSEFVYQNGGCITLHGMDPREDEGRRLMAVGLLL